MSVPRKTISPEAVAMARHLYEETNVPMRDIAALLGISKSTLGVRVRHWAWAPRARRLPTQAPPNLVPCGPSPPAGNDPAAAPSAAVPPPRAALVARLMGRIEAEILAVEQLMAQAGAARPGPQAATEAERAARTLAILVRALRELAALARNEPEEEDEDARDADAFRRELGDTLERVLAGGKTA